MINLLVGCISHHHLQAKGSVSDKEQGYYREEEFKEQRSHVKREGSYHSHMGGSQKTQQRQRGAFQSRVSV